MGGRGLWQVVKASLLGVPLPLCSCGVLPVAFSLRSQGASKGATVSFLASTPQTGVDSVIATYAVLGPIVTLFRVVAAFVSGVLAGALVVAAYPQSLSETPDLPDEADPGTEPVKPAWQRMLRLGLIDGIIPEPRGGASQQPEEALKLVKEAIVAQLNELREKSPAELKRERYEKFRKMGAFTEG